MKKVKVKKATKKAVTKIMVKKPLPRATPASSSVPSCPSVRGFVCQMCGYEAFKKAGLFHCPLCLICKGCSKKVRYCNCMEGE